MSFQRLTLTFNNDPEPFIGSGLGEVLRPKITILSTGTDVFYTFTLVDTLVDAFDVLITTPTSNIGEAIATSFENSFNLALNGSGDYLVTRTINEVVIEVLNSDIVFSAFRQDNPDQFLNVDAVLDQEVTPEIFKERINVRSPRIITAPIFDGVSNINPESVEFNIYIWSGDFTTDKPAEPNYTYIKQPRFVGDQIIYLDIAPQIIDFIEHKYNGVLDAQNVFVSYEVNTTYNNGQNLLSGANYIAFDGYNNFIDNVNYTPINDLSISNKYISVLKGEEINLPFYVGGANYTIEFRQDTTVLDTQNVVLSTIENTDNSIVNISYQDDTVNNIRIINNDTTDEEILDVEIVEECKYTPIKCVFVNKNGVKQPIWFYKANKESFRVEGESYKRSILSESIVGNEVVINYDTTEHTKVDYNTNGKKTIELNTGYIDEDNNVLIKELLLSEYIWLEINGNITPVNKVSKSANFLTKINDQLVKYTLSFEFSYNEVNDIK